MEGDSLYFRRRAAEERTAAKEAPHPSAQRSHLDMAERYDEIADAIGSGEVLIRLVPPERPAR